MKQHLKLFAMAVCLIASAAIASKSEAQCPASYVHTSVMGGPDFNEYGLLLQAARSTDASCRVLAHDKLRDKLNATWNSNGANYWKGWLMGAYLSLATASAMELAGANTFSLDLDYQINRAINAYDAAGTGAPGDPCGLLATDTNGFQMSRRGNNCMDDHAIAAQGWGWITAYQRMSGRSWSNARARTIDEIKKTLRTYDSICVVNYPLYDQSTLYGMTEANICNKTISDLGTAGNEIVSLNHGNQAVNYGFGLLTSVSAAFVALDFANAPVNPSTELTSDEKKVIKYLWVEAAIHTTSDGRFHRSADGNANCYNVAYPLSGTRMLLPNWGCQDQQFAEGDLTEDSNAQPNWGLTDTAGPRGYKAKMFPLYRFYEKYGFTRGDGSGNGYLFNEFSDTFWKTSDIQPGVAGREEADIMNSFFGPARQETYRELAWKWLDTPPALTAGSEFRVAIKAYNNQYFLASGGGGGALYATSNDKDDAWSTLYIYDLNGAHLRGGDPVAIAIKNGSTKYWMVAENGGGSVVNINRVYADAASTGVWEHFTIERVSGGANDMISNGEQFALKASNGQYVTAVGGGGSSVYANVSSRGAYETFTFTKTEQP